MNGHTTNRQTEITTDKDNNWKKYRKAWILH